MEESHRNNFRPECLCRVLDRIFMRTIQNQSVRQFLIQHLPFFGWSIALRMYVGRYILFVSKIIGLATFWTKIYEHIIKIYEWLQPLGYQKTVNISWNDSASSGFVDYSIISHEVRKKSFHFSIHILQSFRTPSILK